MSFKKEPTDDTSGAYGVFLKKKSVQQKLMKK